MLKRLMNRQELLSRLAQTANLSEASVGALLEALARVAGEEAKSNGGFVLPGIGLIQRKEAQERTGKNPQTGETIRIRAKVSLGLEFASRFKQFVLSSRQEREGMLTTSIWKAPRAVLEAIERDSASAKEWNTLDPKGFPIDENFTALLDEYGDLFAYVLKTEGWLDEANTGGLTVGYVTPETVRDRAATLEAVHLEALEKEGLLDSGTAQEFGPSLDGLKALLKSAATENLGLIIVTYF
jgi:DNA-binding protein HU-beta